jgi:ABC-type nitrate/sulfonate/bicarbonate transport system substrate-binding protein
MVAKARQSEPTDRVILATTDHIVHWHIVARKGIEKLEDLKGKRIAISSLEACTGTVGLIMADRMGWDPVHDIALLEGDYSIKPLQKGWVDALIAYEVPLAMARAAGYQPMKVDLRSWNEPIPCNGVWASKSWAHQNKDTVLRFLRSLTEAIAMMSKDKRVAFKSIGHWYTIDDSELQNIIYASAAEMPRKPYPAVDGIKRAMELYDSAAMRRFKAEDFYDDSFMRELDQSGFIDKLYQ